MAAPGESIGSYRISAKLGAGGMGEVWRATDTRLGREVALKVLPAAFARDPERVARFEREAKALAALNHPHIAQVYGLEQGAQSNSGGIAPCLIMEMVKGKPLQGPLPLATAADYASQILDALAAAHEKGIVHRDLKPANILVTKQGIKLLDFGSAKLAQAPLADSDETLSQALTQRGQIMGTLQYMSPEQLNGKTVDAHSDLFSFGCVLYEMLSGKRAFDGQSAASVMAAVLEREPAPLDTAPPLERVIRRALAKDPEQRFQTARDLKASLAWALENPPAAGAAPRSKGWMITVTVLAVVAVALGALLWRADQPVSRPLTRLSLDLGPEAMSNPNLAVAISPDGRRLVYTVAGPNGQQLATRLLDQDQPTLLEGTEGATEPFFSPDGQSIGFFVVSGGSFDKVALQGGAPVMLAKTGTPVGFGANWETNNDIVAPLGSVGPLYRIPAAGGVPALLTRLAPGEVTQRWPQALPGGDAVLFTAAPSAAEMDDADIEVLSRKSGAVKIVQRGSYYGRYLPGGFLLYMSRGVLYGIRFDLGRMQERGAPVPLLDDVAADP